MARLAGLLAVAALPAITDSFATALTICAAVCGAGGVIAWLTVRAGAELEPTIQPAAIRPCNEPVMAKDSASDQNQH